MTSSNKHLPSPVALTQGTAPLSVRCGGTCAPMSLVMLLNGDRKIHPRSQNLSLSKQPNLDSHTVIREQSPSFPKRQTETYLLFWGSVSQASISLKVSEIIHFTQQPGSALSSFQTQNRHLALWSPQKNASTSPHAPSSL